MCHFKPRLFPVMQHKYWCDALSQLLAVFYFPSLLRDTSVNPTDCRIRGLERFFQTALRHDLGKTFPFIAWPQHANNMSTFKHFTRACIDDRIKE